MNEAITKAVRPSVKRSSKKAVRHWSDEIIMLRPRSKEWNAAWKGLAELSGDHDREAENPRSGEVWQYMGTAKRVAAWAHEFRHRDHPSTNDRLYLRVYASPSWKAEDEQHKKRQSLH